MEISIILALVCAIISPLLHGLMNVFDKYVVSYKVNKPLGYIVDVGLAHLCFGIILALFIGWSGIMLKDMLFPAITGTLLTLQTFLYFVMIKQEDVSHMVGFYYFFPVVVALLSFLFLNEVLSLVSYIGMFLIIAGIVMLSLRMKEIKMKMKVWMIISMIMGIALYEFFVKVATNNLPVLNGIALNSIFLGITIMPILFSKNIRVDFLQEFKNIKWAFAIESFTFLGIATLYFAMKALPATVVSSLSAIQPLAVLFYEKMLNKRIKICRDESFGKKFLSIILIVIGIVLIYSQEIIKMLVK